MSDLKLELTGYFAFMGYAWIVLLIATSAPIYLLLAIELTKKLVK